MPVDIASGKVYLEREDVRIPGIVELQWARRYDRELFGRPPGSMGHGWITKYDSILVKESGGFAFTTPTGATEFLPGSDVVDRGGRARNLSAFVELFRKNNRYVVQTWDVDTGAIWRYCFAADASGGAMPLVCVEDATGNGLDIIRDRIGRLALIRQRAEGRSLNLAYGSDGLLCEVALLGTKGERRVLVRYEYDLQARLTAAFDANDVAERYEYDTYNHLRRELAKDGGVFSYQYDSQNRCVRISGIERYGDKRLRYLESARITEITDTRGATFRYHYLPSGQITEAWRPNGSVTRTQYDEFGRITGTIDASGSRTSFVYDEAGNRLALTDALGQTHTYTYNIDHLPTSVTDPLGYVWQRIYDESNRLITTVDPLGGRSTVIYDKEGHAVEIVNPVGDRRYQRWSGGTLQAVTDWAGNRTRFDVDEFGRVISRHDALGGVTSIKYDLVGNPVEILLPDSTAVRGEYDLAGNLIRFADSNGSITTFRYGPCRRLLERTNPLGGTVRYVWGSEPDDLVQIINEAGETHTFHRDMEGRIVRERAFDGAEREFEYDGDGYVVVYRNANGQCTTVERDALHRIIKETLADGSVVTFTYDPNGSLVSAVNSSVAVNFERDPMGRVLREMQDDYWIESRYDAGGNLTGINTSLNHSVTYGYDKNGNVRGFVHEGQTVSFERNAFGQEVARTMPGNLLLEQRFDSLGRMVEQSVGRRDGEVQGRHRSRSSAYELFRRQYMFHPAGTLANINDSHWGRTSYSYDPLEQLSGVMREPGRSEQYSYDQAGNRAGICIVAPGAATDDLFQYGAGNRLLKRGNARAYEYDEEGRRTRMAVNRDAEYSGSWQYEWNVEDRLSAVTTPDGHVWKYCYDALGRRVGKSGPSGETRFVWRGDLLIHELSMSSKADPVSWIYAGNLFTPIAQVSHGRMHSIVTDHIGSPREMLDAFGRVAWRLNYGAFGTGDTEIAGTAKCPFRFQGQYRDPETGLHYNRFRYYDPEIGSFISPDPLGVRGGLNQYSYGRNPTGWVDPLGLTTEYPTLAEVPYVRNYGDELVAMSKPSTKDQLLQTHTYVNPGHHDPSSPNYIASKSVLPENHIDLFHSSIPVETKSGKVVRWAREGSGRDAVYHRFEQHADGEFHWNGSTAGVTKGGKSRAIPEHLVPACAKK